jgi:hypothetical protein
MNRVHHRWGAVAVRKSSDEFDRDTQSAALVRQQGLCASCGTHIAGLGETGRAAHKYGEIAHAHHMLPVKSRGSCQLTNCVIICQSCHYSAHEGGNYRFGTVTSSADDYPFFEGRKGKKDRT